MIMEDLRTLLEASLLDIDGTLEKGDGIAFCKKIEADLLSNNEKKQLQAIDDFKDIVKQFNLKYMKSSSEIKEQKIYVQFDLKIKEYEIDIPFTMFWKEKNGAFAGIYFSAKYGLCSISMPLRDRDMQWRFNCVASRLYDLTDNPYADAFAELVGNLFVEVHFKHKK